MQQVGPVLERVDGLDQHQGRQLPPGEDVVSDAHLTIRQRSIALVDPLVAPADEDKVTGSGQLTGEAIVEALSGRIQEDHVGSGGAQRLNCRIERLRPHDHPGSATVGVVIDGVVAPDAVRSQVVGLHVHHSALDRTTDDRDAQRQVEQLWKERHHVDAQEG